MTACDCSQPQYIGTVNVSRFSSCHMPPTDIYYRDIIYSLYEQKHSLQKFSGFACRQWKNIVRINSFWTGSSDTVFSELEVNLSAEACWSMVQSSMCASNRMLKEGISWHFEGKHVPESRYSQTVQKEVLNCIFEEVTFEQSHDSDAVFCLKGKISETH
jgi:hypothetical protein